MIAEVEFAKWIEQNDVELIRDVEFNIPVWKIGNHFLSSEQLFNEYLKYQ